MRDALRHWNITSTALTAVGWTGGGAHALVIRGYYQDTSVSMQDVYWIDPADASYHEDTYAWFVGNYYWNWLNTVSNIYV